jgi:hypothetical protein
MAVKIQIRRDSAADWTSNNPTLSEGEIGWESDTGKLKIGDGATAWVSLTYHTVLASDPVWAAKGDLIVASGNNAAAVLPIGTDNYVLRVATDTPAWEAEFDATDPSTQAFGDAAAVGSAAVSARRDHKHSMMADPVTGHKDLTTGVHGVGAGTIAKTADITATKLDDFATPDANTNLNANTTNHGLLLQATAPAAGLTNVVAIENGETVYKNKALFDTTHPSALGTAAEGTGTTAARIDHVHANPAIDTLAAATDITTLDTSTTAHGLAPKAVAPAAGYYNYVGITNGETAYTNKALSTAPIMVAASDATDREKTMAGLSGGYVCDGTNDHTDINAAITAVSAVGGGKVILSSGEFKTGATIAMLDGVELQMNGSIILPQAETFAAITIADKIYWKITGSNWWISYEDALSIERWTAQQGSTNAAAIGITITGASNCAYGTIEGPGFIMYANIGIKAQNANCWAYTVSNIVTRYTGANGIYLGGGLNVTFRNIELLDAYAASFYAYGCSSLGVFGGGCEATQTGGVTLDTCKDFNFMNFDIENTHPGEYSGALDVSNCKGRMQSCYWYGNTIGADYGAIIYLHDASLVTFDNCHNEGDTGANANRNTFYVKGDGSRAICAPNCSFTATSSGTLLGQTYTLDTSGTMVYPEGISGYVAPGEKRCVYVNLTAGNVNAYAFNWQNPENRKIIVKRVVVYLSAAGGTANSVLDIGVINATATHSDTIIDGLALNTTGVFDSSNSTDKGTNGMVRALLVDENGGTNDWITGQILVANAASLAGKVMIEYMGA